MIPTLIGLAVALVGLFLLVTADVAAMLAFAAICSLMNGSAALLLPSLGGSSVPPAHLALVFLFARLLLPGSGQIAQLGPAVRANAMLLVFVGYGVVSAFALPRLFKGQIDLVPLRPGKLRYLLEQFPLAPSSQNTTTAVYLVGTLLFALLSYVVARDPRTPRRFAKTGVVILWLHMALGVASVALAKTPFIAILNFFRNGTYAQLSHGYGTFVRMRGISPEASAFAAFGFVWLVFSTECCLRGVLPRWTGPASIAMTFVLLFSTSSTAYASIAVYLLLLIVRAMLAPQRLRRSYAGWIAASLLGAAIGSAAVLILAPHLADRLLGALSHFTIDKQGSTSAIQRGFWAKQGWDAFQVSMGLGVGAGSFRSSSLVMAILGSMGVVGVGSFAIYLLQVFKPLRASSYGPVASEEQAVGVAASWAVLMMLVPLGIGSASPDPGHIFAIFSGLALGLRATSAGHVRSRPQRPAPRPRPARRVLAGPAF